MKLNKIVQLEKLTKIELSNSKRDESKLLKVWTSYINESELANRFVYNTKNSASIPIKLQLLKGRANNRIVSQEIESYLAKLRQTCGVGAMNAKYCSINNIKLNDRHITIFIIFRLKIKIYSKGDQEAKESRNKTKVKSIKQYTKKGNEPQMKITGVWPSKLQLTNYDLQKIEFLVNADKNIEISWKSVKRNWSASTFEVI